jgi:hypothetical protein
LGKKEQDAIEAVARHFSATWEKGEGLSGGFLKIGRKRIAVEVATIKQRIAEPAVKFRLRFDKVVFEVVGRLQADLSDAVPDGKVVIVTITAPIRLASKTTAILEDRIRSCLARKSAQAEITDTIHGNQIQIRVVKSGAAQSPKVIGLVHNPHPDPKLLLDMMQSVIETIGAAARERAPARSAKERWLVVVDEGGFPHLETYRRIVEQLSLPTGFQKILMVFAGGRVAALAD